MKQDHQIRGYKPQKETTKGNDKGNKEKSLEVSLKAFNHNLDHNQETRPGDHFLDVLEIFRHTFGNS